MSNTEPYELTIEKLKDILDDGPIIPRFYEITYLKPSKKMTVNIYNDDKCNEIYKGQGLCGGWKNEKEKYLLLLQINVVSDENIYDKVKERDKIIREEIPLMLNSIIKSDGKFFEKNKGLNESDVFIKFNSPYDDFYKVENWGPLKKYSTIEINDEKAIREMEYKNSLKKMEKIIAVEETIILNLLAPHIELYLSPMYGKSVRFLIKDMKILNMEELDEIKETGKEYKMVVAVNILNNDLVDEILLNVGVRQNGISIKKIA